MLPLFLFSVALATDIFPHSPDPELEAPILDQKGIAIRAGHHCAQPLMKHFNISSTARASIGVYSKEEEVDALIEGLKTVKKLLG